MKVIPPPLLLTAALAGATVLGCGQEAGRSASVFASPCVGAQCEQRCDDAGDAEACTDAAQLYFDGANGHPLDVTRSFRFAQRACERGSPYGCALLGLHYQDGRGTDWDPGLAVATYERACAAGSGIGCFNLSTMFSIGQGVDLDHSRAEALVAQAGLAWKAACEGREPRWCANYAYWLGRAPDLRNARREQMRALDQRTCDAGFLVGCVEAVALDHELERVDADTAVARLTALCDQGAPTACTTAASMLISGVYTEERGLALYRRGCEIGDPSACMSGRSDQAERSELLQQACDRGWAHGCFELATEHLKDGRETAVIDDLRRACQMGHAESCTLVGKAYFNGRGVAASEPEAVRWTTEGCRAGSDEACIELVRRDLEVPAPLDGKKSLYTKACAAGVPHSCERLAALPSF